MDSSIIQQRVTLCKIKQVCSRPTWALPVSIHDSFVYLSIHSIWALNLARKAPLMKTEMHNSDACLKAQ